MFGAAGIQVHELGGGATIVAMVDVQKLSVEEWILSKVKLKKSNNKLCTELEIVKNS